MISGRRIARVVHAFFKINDVQGKVIGLSDLLNMELRSDSVKIFDYVWDETL